MTQDNYEIINFSEGKDRFKKLSITINDKVYTLGPHVPLTTSLVEFIRHYANLCGTKRLCQEGGCGACTVIRKKMNTTNGQVEEVFSILSCQTLVYGCIDWTIETIEHLGNKNKGFSSLQLALHHFGGTQCGYCTPGFLMTMYGQQKSCAKLTTNKIERSFDGNLCRCTGYRPILDAFKCFASDAPDHLKKGLADIEDAAEKSCLINRKVAINGKEFEEQESIDSKLRFGIDETIPKRSMKIEADQSVWYRPSTLEEVYKILNRKITSDNIRIVVGNTGQGVFKNDGPFNVYIHVLDIHELNIIVTDPILTIGANVSLNKCIEIFHKVSANGSTYQHLSEVARHWQVVANVGVRNVGSWAGNIMMKRRHLEFPSDIFITFVALEARLSIGNVHGEVEDVSIEDFMSKDMSSSIILSVTIPPQRNVVFNSYKITPRAVNAHAYINAAFKYSTNPMKVAKIKTNPIIAIGGINSSFVRAKKTEEFLQEKTLNPAVIKEAVSILGSELNPDFNYHDAAPAYRKSLAQSLLYKSLITQLNGTEGPFPLTPNIISRRPNSSSEQIFETDEKSWPLNRPIQKLESLYQVTGEARYMDDIPPLPNELFGAFVQSTIANGFISKIDTKDCLAMPGVIDFISAIDIPGKNSFFSSSFGKPDPVFADGKILYAGQSIGLVVAESPQLAKFAARHVKVSYKDTKKPVLTAKEAIKNGRFSKSLNFDTMKTDPLTYGDVEDGFQNSDHVFEGEIFFGGQFHFSLEPLAARVIPVEQGYDVFCTTQWPTEAQVTVAENLNMPTNCINVDVLRLGGGFGGKISRVHILSSAAAVAARKLKTPVRITLDLNTHMTLVGWREPYYSKYKVGFNNDGRLQAVDVEFFADVGISANEVSSFIAATMAPTVYYCPNWRVQPYEVTTDTATNTYCRAPGYVIAIGTSETIIERVAHTLKKDVLYVREANLASEIKPQFMGNNPYDNVMQTKILPLMKKQANVEKRQLEVKKFNKNNRWMKRGLSVLPMRYPLNYIPFFQYNVQIVIYQHDGSIVIKHGGIEMGQGINTKIAQVAASILGVPLHLIKVKSTDVFTGANSSSTSASHGSDLNSYGVKICCERILKRMNPIIEKLRKKGVSNPTWIELVQQSFKEGVDLSERYFTFSQEHPESYDVWGLVCMEVELDVLTGQYLILRTDIIEDCGKSLNPLIDIGQIEGAFAMGLGLYTTEKLKFNPETGEKISNGTWDYKPPTALDIPSDFRVTVLPNAAHKAGVLQSKATGEPAVCMGYVAVTALREAITSAREDAGCFDWFEIDTPLTVEDIFTLCKVDLDNGI